MAAMHVENRVLSFHPKGELFKGHKTVFIVIHTCYYGNGHMDNSPFRV